MRGVPLSSRQIPNRSLGCRAARVRFRTGPTGRSGEREDHAEPMGYAALYDPDLDFDRWYTDATGQVIAADVTPGERILELGCATGRMTAALVRAGAEVEGIDREADYLARARERNLAGATFHGGDVMRPPVDGGFDHVVLANILHEVPDPRALLAVGAAHAVTGGAVHVTVPNPRSLHRLLALSMGLLNGLTDLGDRARQFETLGFIETDAVEAWGVELGLRVTARRGIVLKPLPNDAMAALDAAVVAGFVAVADLFPEHCALNYLCLRNGAGR